MLKHFIKIIHDFNLPPGGHVIYNLVYPSLLISTIFSVCLIYNVCIGAEKKIFKMYGHTLAHKLLFPGDRKFTFLVKPSLIIIVLYSGCLSNVREKRRRVFKK